MAKRESSFDMSTNWPVEKKKKRRSRWGTQTETEKIFIPGMPTTLPPNLSKEQEEQYLLHLQIEEISRRLRTGDLGIPANPEDRSPSPEPIYNNEGKRLNTREYRTRKKLEETRHSFIQKAASLNTEYKPPADYKPPVIRVSDKVMIPQDDHPDINFVGLLIGPRGNTLKNLEKDTGAKIIIRGKGSVKEGKIGRKDGQPLPGEDEPLHAYITANNPENVKKAVEKIKVIIEQGIEVPEGQNDLRRQQLRELALLNGTLRENDGLNKLKQLAQAQTIVTNTIICQVCGGAGHLAQDCKQRRPGDSLRQALAQNQNTQPVDKAKMDSEYMSLMAELGEGPPPTAPATAAAPRPNMIPPNSRFGAPPPDTRPSDRPQRFEVPPPLMQQQTLQSQPPWQQQQQPPNQAPPRPAPPSLMNLNTHPPPSLGQPPPNFNMPPGAQPPQQQQQQPPPMGMSQPPPLMSAPTGLPPPWQQSVQTTPQTMPTTNPTYTGVAPPSLLSAPPPPPPSSQPLPWQQQPQPPTSMSMSAPPPWQQPPSAVAPPPPPTSSSIPPWQQPHPVAPPPPPPNSSFNPVAPPPPPPSGMDHMNNMGIAPLLGVPPPPPPN
ncbi:unnamed protein product [Owenia fusiformis]|uniref:Branchpoint-bridging protein n=1 Tax=Owenia fusiformis TaxID=6347 RepID=A0A8J1U5X8_OWEFU|nr:unnamed protein product [Owenia fusiformis]